MLWLLYMEEDCKDKAKKKLYKNKWKDAERVIEMLKHELNLLRDERDRAIGERCLVTANLKETSEELSLMHSRFEMLENNYVKQKVEHANLKSLHESMSEDFEIIKKMLTARDKEIQNLTKQQEIRRKKNPETPTRSKELLKPPSQNKNIRPFPSSSFSFNFISSSNKNSFTSSFREEDH